MSFIIQERDAERAGRVAGDELLQEAIDEKQDILTAGENITIENNVISATGGGSSEGAVRYDEAQTLTDAQKNQAKANQGLPYYVSSNVCMFEDATVQFTTSNKNQTIYSPQHFNPTSFKVGDTFSIECTYNGVTENTTATVSSAGSSSLNATVYETSTLLGYGVLY